MEDQESYQFLDIVESRELEEFARIILDFTKIPIAVVSPEGITSAKQFFETSSFSPICQVIVSTEDGDNACRECDRIHLERVKKKQKGEAYLCHAGLLDFAVPVYVGYKHIATINTGQLLTKPPSREDFKILWNNVKHLKINKHDLEEAYFKAEYIPPEKIDRIIQFMVSIAKFSCETGRALRISRKYHKYPE